MAFLYLHASLCLLTYSQAGPRICLGQNLALLEMKYALSRLVLQFRLKLEQDPSTVTYASTLTLPIKGEGGG